MQGLNTNSKTEYKTCKYKSGDVISVWGEEYKISFRDSRTRNSLELKDGKAILKMKKETTPEQREAFVKEWYRTILKDEIDIILPQIESKTNLQCSTYGTKLMTTRWGSCNTKTKKIWLNIQLAQKPKECLEYVMLHELLHTQIAKHSKDFNKNLEAYLPNWREIHKKLNQ